MNIELNEVDKKSTVSSNNDEFIIDISMLEQILKTEHDEHVKKFIEIVDILNNYEDSNIDIGTEELNTHLRNIKLWTSDYKGDIWSKISKCNCKNIGNKLESKLCKKVNNSKCVIKINNSVDCNFCMLAKQLVCNLDKIVCCCCDCCILPPGERTYVDETTFKKMKESENQWNRNSCLLCTIPCITASLGGMAFFALLTNPTYVSPLMSCVGSATSSVLGFLGAGWLTYWLSGNFGSIANERAAILKDYYDSLAKLLNDAHDSHPEIIQKLCEKIMKTNNFKQAKESFTTIGFSQEITNHILKDFYRTVLRLSVNKLKKD